MQKQMPIEVKIPAAAIADTGAVRIGAHEPGHARGPHNRSERYGR